MRHDHIGIIAAVLLLAFALPAAAAPHYEADVTWTQPAPTTQTGYRLERKLGATGTYQSLTAQPIGAAVRTFRDVGPYQDGQVVCWRVTALGQPGSPAPSETTFDEVCMSAPVQLPGKGTMQIQWQFIPN